MDHKEELLAWLEKNPKENNGFEDTDTAQYIQKMFAGFMLAPKETRNGVDLIAKTRVAFSLEEIITEFGEQSKTHELYLYKITFFPSVAIYIKADPNTFQPIFLDKPEMSKARWHLRYEAIERV